MGFNIDYSVCIVLMAALTAVYVVVGVELAKVNCNISVFRCILDEAIQVFHSSHTCRNGLGFLNHTAEHAFILFQAVYARLWFYRCYPLEAAFVGWCGR